MKTSKPPFDPMPIAMIAPLPEKRSSWPEIFAALVPFIIYGPFRSLLSQAIAPEARVVGGLSIGTLLGLGLLVVLGLLGCGLGWTKNFPRWFFPYLGVVLMLPTIYLTDTLFTILWDRSALTRDILQAGVWAASLMILVGLILWVSGRIAWLRSLYNSVQRDWTQLSLCVAFLAATTFSGPQNSLFNVLVPPVFMTIAAFGSLLSTHKRTRMLWLLSGFFVVSGFRLSLQTTTLPLVIAWFVLLLLPGLIDLRLPPAQSS